MGKTRSRLRNNNKKSKVAIQPNNKKQKQKQKQKQRQKQLPPQPHSKNPFHDHDRVLFGPDEPDSAADDLCDPGTVHRLLEPYNKDQLINFLLEAAASDPALLAQIRTVADRGVAHRKLFVRGLGWDATNETLLEVFRPYGSIEDCNVVVDKATGRSKGFGFVLFSTRAGAVKALKQPEKKIKNRLAYCQLASIGNVATAGGASAGSTGSTTDVSERKIYVSNVHADAAPDKLKTFFAQFGEIESGPIGYDMVTGKSRGFAMFVYKTKDGAKKVLEEPYKMFDGHQLHCKLAFDHSQKRKAQDMATNTVPQAALLGAVPQSVLAAVAAAQNLAMYSQNPAYAALLGQNPLLAAAALNPAAAMAAFNPAAAAFNPAAQSAFNPTAGLFASQDQALGGGVGVGLAPSLLGGYGSQVMASLQGLQSYQGSQIGQSSSTKIAGSYGGLHHKGDLRKQV